METTSLPVRSSPERATELFELIEAFRIAQDAGDRLTALRLIDRAWRIASKNPEINYLYGLWLVRDGSAKAALSLLETAAASGNDPNIEAVYIAALCADGSIDYASERLQNALGRFAVAAGSPLANAARQVAARLPTAGGRMDCHESGPEASRGAYRRPWHRTVTSSRRAKVSSDSDDRLRRKAFHGLRYGYRRIDSDWNAPSPRSRRAARRLKSNPAAGFRVRWPGGHHRRRNFRLGSTPVGPGAYAPNNPVRRQRLRSNRRGGGGSDQWTAIFLIRPRRGAVGWQ